VRMTRESLLIATLVELADNLVDDFDVIEVLTMLCNRCVETIDVDAAGVMLLSPAGELQYVASSSESMRILELYQIQTAEGPCVECFNSGEAIIDRLLDDARDQWPNFSPLAIEQGFNSVYCLPMRLRGRIIGALNFFRVDADPLDESDVVVAQGLSGVATIAILQHQTSLDAKVLNSQLSKALDSRIIIEQAKGMVSQATNCDVDEAFNRLRTHARNHNARLTAVANSVVDGTIRPQDLDAAGTSTKAFKTPGNP
jgi:GAF domain-containing protein